MITTAPDFTGVCWSESGDDMSRSGRTPVYAGALAVALTATADGVAAANWPSNCVVAQRKCLVEVMVATNAAGQVEVTVDPEPVETPKVTGRVRLIWKLPRGYAFSTPNGDGVTFKTAQSEFEDDAAVGADESTAQLAPQRKFKWVVTKRLPAPREYNLIFHEFDGKQLGKRYECDPMIANFDSSPILKGGVSKISSGPSGPLSCK